MKTRMRTCIVKHACKRGCDGTSEKRDRLWGWDESLVNGSIDKKEFIRCKSGNPEGHEISTGPRNLDGPQSVLSGASQGFDFYIDELDFT